MKKLLTIALAASMILALSVNSFALGNYVLSTEELGSEEDVITEEPTEETPAASEIVAPEENKKENPNTGAADFTGVAIAATTIAGIGLVVLKKR